MILSFVSCFLNLRVDHSSTTQALETYPLFLALSIIGGVKHPITTALAGVLWIHGRKEWAAAYAKNGPAGRYASKWSRFIWCALRRLG